MRKVQTLGFDAILERALSRTERLPRDVAYIGFSNGGACAELVAATRPGARGAILVHAPLMLRDLGWKIWPAGVPVQVHFAQRDPVRVQTVVDALGARVRRSGSSFEVFDYDSNGHLFTDAGLPVYDEAATRLLKSRVIEFLGRL